MIGTLEDALRRVAITIETRDFLEFHGVTSVFVLHHPSFKDGVQIEFLRLTFFHFRTDFHANHKFILFGFLFDFGQFRHFPHVANITIPFKSRIDRFDDTDSAAMGRRHGVVRPRTRRQVQLFQSKTAAKSVGNAGALAVPIDGDLRHQRKAFLRQASLSVGDAVAVAPNAICRRLQMQQMLERLVEIEGGDESTGVEAHVGDQFGELLLEPDRETDEEKGQVVFHLAHGGFGEAAEAEAVIGDEEQDAFLQVASVSHPLEQAAGRFVGHLDAIEDVVRAVRVPHPREERVLGVRTVSGEEVLEPGLLHIPVALTAEAFGG